MKRARIILADDHVLLLEAFRNLLEPEFEVIATFANGRALVAGAPLLNPDVIVLDISMPLLNGLDAGERLKQIVPDAKLVYLTMNQDPDLAAEAFRLGAAGYLVKNSSASELSHAIREALRGRFYVTPMLTKGLVGSLMYDLNCSKRSDRLTLRQREVLQLLAEGLSMKEVGSLLDISARTVAFHKYTMMEHLQIKTNAELIQFAIENSIGSR